MTRTTIADVARAARVHPSTVSRVLNRAPGLAVRDETRERVIATAATLGYRPSAVARGLRLRRTRTLGMLIPDITNPFFPPIIRGAEEAARARGYDVLLANTDDLPEREAEALRLLREREVDGLLLATSRMADATIAGLRRDRFPFVLVNRGSRSPADPAVIVESVRAAGAVVAHLADLGHRRIAHIAGPLSTTTAAERAAGFRAACRRLRLDGVVEAAAAYSEAAGHAAALALLARREPPTAIFGANDLLALGALRAAREVGLGVPRNLSLVGFNDIPLAELIEPPLTTVRVPQREMGDRAVAMLIGRLEGERQRTSRIVLATALVVRASTAAPRAVRRIA